MSENSEGELSQDTLFSLLSNPRRRFMIQYLNRTGEPISLHDLAATVAAWEHETDPQDLTDKQRKRLYVSLYQTHVPKLEEAGIIDYDSDSGEIRLMDPANDITSYLDSDAGQSTETRPWNWYYLLFMLAVVLASGLIAVSGIPLDQTDLLLFSLGSIVLLATLGVFHYLDTRYGNEN